MERIIICDVCKKRIADMTCKLCGRRVCKEDFDNQNGVCNNCKHGRDMGRHRVRTF